MATYAKTIFMIRNVMVALLLLTITHSATAQTPKSSLLWEISGNGLTQPSYLFGTFHLMCKTDFIISDVLENKIKSTSQLYGELKMDDPQLQMKLMGKMSMNGKTLQSLLSEADFTAVSARFQSLTGLPLLAFNNFKPFLPMSMLTLKSLTCAETVQPETEFVGLAKKWNLPVMGLETVDDQMNAIDQQPIDSQMVSLKKTILNFDSVQLAMQEMSNVYRLRDVDSLYSYMKHMGVDDNFETALLTNRNEKWAPLINEIIRQKSSFFAVGAGHLGGPNGVIYLLRKQGYRLTPVKY